LAVQSCHRYQIDPVCLDHSKTYNVMCLPWYKSLHLLLWKCAKIKPNWIYKSKERYHIQWPSVDRHSIKHTRSLLWVNYKERRLLLCYSLNRVWRVMILCTTARDDYLRNFMANFWCRTFSQQHGDAVKKIMRLKSIDGHTCMNMAS
jgi:hypothetical protein